VEAGNESYYSENGVLFVRDRNRNRLLQYPAAGKAEAYTVPTNVTDIEEQAFSYCSGLKSVTIPGSVITIGASAFYRCSGLTDVTVGWVTPLTVPTNIFRDVPLSNVTLHVLTDTKSKYETAAVWNEFKMIEEDGEPIGPVASGMTDLFIWSLSSDGTLTISGEGKMPDYHHGVDVPWYSLQSSITKVVIEEGVTHIGGWAFSAYYGNITSVTIPVSVKTIGAYAFYRCGSLASVTIPDNVTTIGESAFSGCSDLTSVTIPGSVKTIGAYAFGGCSFLESVTISGSVTTIEENVFFGCNRLINVTVGWAMPLAVPTTIFRDVPLSNVTLHVLAGTKSKYETAAVWKEFKMIEEDGEPIGLIGSGETGSSLIWLLSSDGTLTISGTGAMPDYHHGDNIPWDALQSFITTVVIEEGVTYIGGWAFCANYGNITSVTIPGSVTTIGTYAFYKCSGLTSVTIPGSVTTIGASAFSVFSGLTSVTIPGSVTTIEAYAFGGCSALTSVTIPGSVTTIGEHAFYSCSGLTNVFVGWEMPPAVPANIFREVPLSTATLHVLDGMKLNYETAAGWSEFKAIEEDGEPTGLTGILTWSLSSDGTLTISGVGAMADYDNVDDVPWYAHKSSITTVVIEEGVTHIGSWAFHEHYNNITSVRIPGSVTTIGERAFGGCSGLTSVRIPGSVTTIGERAFEGCSGLTSINIPASVTTIGSYAFQGCIKLIFIEVEAGNEFYSSEDGVLFIENGNRLLQYPAGKAGDYIVPTDVTGIEEYAFGYCSGLTSITIPSSVTTIGERAFYSCSGLTDVFVEWAMPRAVSTNIFEGIPLENVTLHVPAGTQSQYKEVEGWKGFKDYVGDGELTGETGHLTWLLSSDGTLTISGEGAMADYDNVVVDDVPWYAYKSSITTVVIEEGVTHIGSWAFYEHYHNITSVRIPGSVTTIGERAFGGCSGLTSVRIPGSVTTIGARAFEGCSGLTSINIPASVTTIGSYAFQGCIKLTFIKVEAGNDFYSSKDGVLFIENGNKLLLQYPAGKSGTSYTIPTDVTGIEERAFADCSGLMSITIPSNVTTIGDYAFTYCTKLTDVFVEWTELFAVPTNIFEEVPLQNVTLHVFAGTQSQYEEAEGWKTFRFKATVADGEPTGLEASGEAGPLTWSLSLGGTLTISGEGAMPNYSNGNTPTWYDYRSSIKTVVIENGVTHIGARAFYEYYGNITSVTIPRSVTTIGALAFSRCSGLTSITVEVENDYYYSTDGVLFIENGNKLLQYPAGKVGAYIVPEDVTGIEEWAFSFCPGLTSVTIPSSVTGIGDFVFAYCLGLKTVFVNWTIPVSLEGSVSYIGNSAFYNGINLSDLILYVPSGTKAAYQAAPVWQDFGKIVEIDEDSENRDLDIVDGVLIKYRGAGGRVVIPNGVTGIGNKAFVDCVGLSSVKIPDQVTNIGDNAFYGCISLASVEIPSQVVSIGKSAFGRCISLASVEIAGSVVSIGESAFEGCISLLSVKIPASVTGIGRNAFGGCSSLFAVEADVANRHYLSENGILYNRDKTELYIYPAGKSGAFSIPGSVVSVGTYAFSGNRGLRSVEIPGSVTSLGYNAFGGCSSLMDVTVEWAEPLLLAADASVFEGVLLSVCTLHVPVGAEAVYKKADVWKDFGTVVQITPELTVPAKEIAFAFGGGRDSSVIVVSNMDWKIVSGGTSWLTVIPPVSGGFGRDTIRLEAEENNTGSVRRDTLVFEGGGLTCRVAVVQRGQPLLSVSPSETEGDRGTIDISLNIPIDETFTVKFSVNLPSGFHLNQVSLATELLNSFDLDIIESNTSGGWLLSIGPKVSTLSATETSYCQVVQIAFTMDGTVESGEHEVKINDVDLRLNSGQTVHQGEITIPVTVTNPVGNAVVGSTEIVYASGRLSVNTPVSERITVYALSGAVIYQSQKMPGSVTFDLSDLPRGLMIVRGDSGWVKKIVR
jgi:hypothetical protein